MKFLGRRGVEIAAGTIIMLIVSIVVLGLALTLTYNVFCSAEDMAESVSAQNRDQINRLLTSGGRVVVPDNNREARVQGSFMCGSSRTQAVDFALGIRNHNQERMTFTVTVRAVNEEANFADHIILSLQGIDSGDTEVSQQVTLDAGEAFTGLVLVNLPLSAAPGQYQYSVQVLQGSALHGAQMMYVTIP